MINEPVKVEIERVLAGLGCMGIEDAMNDVRSVLIEPHAVTVTRYRFNETGRVTVGREDTIAIVTVVMPIDYPKKPVVPADLVMPDLTDEEKAAFVAEVTS